MTDIFVQINGVNHLVQEILFVKRGKFFELKGLKVNGVNHKALNLDFWSVAD
jgi:hypothetical protein